MYIGVNESGARSMILKDEVSLEMNPVAQGLTKINLLPQIIASNEVPLCASLKL